MEEIFKYIIPYLGKEDQNNINLLSKKCKNLVKSYRLINYNWWKYNKKDEELINGYISKNGEYPPNVTHLQLDDCFNEVPDLKYLTHLNFGGNFNQEIDLRNNICLTHIIFGDDFNNNFVLPSSVQYIRFGQSFNQPIDLIYLQNLTNIRFGSEFNNLLKLSISITSIKFGDNFNKPINFVSLINLRVVKFGFCFDHPLECSLPFSLKKLKLGQQYNHSTIFIQELNLEYLELGNQSINKLPSSLRHLNILTSGNPLPCLPPLLKSLEAGYYFNHQLPEIPPSLTYLKLGYYFNKKIYLEYTNINVLVLGNNYNQELCDLPKTLKRLILSGTYNHPIPELPSLTHLTLSDCFNSPFKGNLYKNLIYLKFGDEFDQSIILPPNLEEIEFGKKFNSSVVYNENLKIVRFGGNFNRSIDELPDSILSIVFPGSSKFNQPINKLPIKLEYLSLRSEFNNTINLLKCDNLKYFILETNLPLISETLKFLSSLVILDLNGEFNQPLDLSSLVNLRELTCGGKFNQNIKLAPNLKSLYLTGDFNRPLFELPIFLEEISFGNDFNQDIGVISNLEFLKILSFGENFNKPITMLPKSLSLLELSDNYDYPLDHHQGLKIIKYCTNY